MDDQYYYLLDGKEQGPFSKAAIESLAANGALASALLRTASDPTWRTAKEIGLSSAKASEQPKPKPAVDKYGFPIKEAVKNSEPGSTKPDGKHHDIDLAILKKSNRYLDSFCLECGYEGRLPILSQVLPWYGRWWGWVLIFILCTIFFGPFGLVGSLFLSLVLGLAAYNNSKYQTQCPSCRRMLTHNQ